VGDTGTGIPRAELPRLFDRFFRVKGARGRTHEGSGIGLSLVRELARLHGGDVRVDSQEGQGSTFTVTLPLGRAHLPAERLRAPRGQESTALVSSAFVEEALRWLPDRGEGGALAAPRSPREQGPDTGARRGRVLAVDDNADMREYLARVLGTVFDVVTAEDGQAALEAVAREGPFDLVLTDVMMPRLGGFGLLKALREAPGTRARRRAWRGWRRARTTTSSSPSPRASWWRARARRWSCRGCAARCCGTRWRRRTCARPCGPATTSSRWRATS
jgi:hypothetical protein